jgi:hypothetical protein
MARSRRIRSAAPRGGTFRGDIEVDVPGDATRAYHVAGELAFGPTCFRPGE